MREALKRTAVALTSGGISFALGGGYAGWALGGPEPEHDVDFLVAEPDAVRAEQVLADAGLRVEHPPEDWLFKVFDGDAMVDLIFRAAGEPVGQDLMDRAVEVEVLSVRMPVLSPTDLLVTKMLALSEHACDYGKVLPSARALREQVEWPQVRERTSHNPFAVALLVLLEQLQVAPAA
ncbi:MAG: hypothetical protein JWM62_1102 [Frankiales bacterium]|nr:hypothetical protein [Frankiales bacterium]